MIASGLHGGSWETFRGALLLSKRLKTWSYRNWYIQEMARYAHAHSKAEANKLQIAAHKNNRYVMRPPSGMVVDKVSLVGQRAANVIKWVKGHGTYDELRLAVDDILGRIEFGTKSDRFESGLLDLGSAIGFGSQRPDKEWKEGPDNLWAVRDAEYFLIEAKSEVSLQRAEIYKEETGQMNNSCAWFEKNYKGAKVTRILIVPAKKLSNAAGFVREVLIMRRRGLERLIGSVRSFFKEFAGMDFKDLSEQQVQQLIDQHALAPEAIAGLCERPI